MPLALLVLGTVNDRLSSPDSSEYEHARASVQTNTTIRGLVEAEGLLDQLTDEQQTYARNYLDGIPIDVSTEFIAELQSAFDQELAIEVYWQDSENGSMGATAAALSEDTVRVTLSTPYDQDFPT